MSPTPTDVGSYQGNGQAAVSGHGTTAPIPIKGGPQREREDSGSSHGAPVTSESRGAPPPRPNSAAGSVTSSQQGASSQANSGGPGHMPSGISVQELKQMTALRMAHEQGHLRVVSPFHYGGQSGQQSSRGSSPAPGERDTTRPALPRTSSSISAGGGSSSRQADTGTTTQRAGRHSVVGSESPPSGGNLDRSLRGGGDIPPTPSSSCGSSRSGQRSRRSPSPQQGRQPSPPPPPSGSSRASPTNSAMPHGLTVQELKELTKMRLAREAFSIPVYAVPNANGQEQQQPTASSTRPSSPKGASRGREASLGANHGCHPESRSPVGARSTPSSPGAEHGDRPHRRTRRGGRRGRNRSPRPDDQYSPKRDEDGDGYSSGSQSPRGRRNHADPWVDGEDHQRSLSQPRAMTRDQHSAPPDNRSASTRRGGERGDRTCAYPGSPGLVPHLDIYGSAPSSMGIGSGTSSGLHNGGSSHNGRMTEAFNLHDVHHRGPNGRPLSLPANSGARGIHQWDPRAAGSGTPIPPGSRSGRASPLQLSESAWLQEVERRRREMGYRGSVDGEHRIGAGHEREHDRRMPQERQRSMQHLERRHANGGGGVDDQAHFRDREEGGGRRVAGMIGPERITTLRGLDLRDDPPPPPGHSRLHRSNSEGVVIANGRVGRMSGSADGRYASHHGGAGGMSPHFHSIENGGGRGSYDHEYYDQGGVHAQHQHNSKRGGVDNNHGAGGGGPFRAEELDADHGGRYDAGHGAGSWTSSSLPHHAPFLATRRTDGMVGSAPTGHGSGGRGYGGAAGIASGGGVRHVSAATLGDGVRDDISFNVAESVLGTPSSKNTGAPVQWRNGQGQSWHGQAPPGAMVASSSSLLHEQDHHHAGYQGQHPHTGHPAAPQTAYGSSSRPHAADDRSTSSSESHASHRREMNGGNLRAPPHLQHPLQPQQPRHDYRGDTRESGSSLSAYGGGGERFDGASSRGGSVDGASMGLNQDDLTERRDSYSAHGSGYHMIGSGNGASSRGTMSGHASPSALPAQSPMLMGGSRFPGSAPGSLHRESFPVMGSVDAGNTPVGSYGAAGGNGRAHASPSLVGGLGMNGAMSDGRSSPVGNSSPLIAGLTFSLDLAGYSGGTGGGGGGQPYRSVAGSEGALSTHGSTSDFLSYETDAAGAGSRSAVGGGGVFPSGSGRMGGGLHGVDGGGIMGSSPALSHQSGGAREPSSLPGQLDIGPSFAGGVGGGMRPPPRVDTSSLFSAFGQGGSGGVDEIAGRRQSRSVSSTPIGGERANNASAVVGSHPGTIGSSRSNSVHSSPVHSTLGGSTMEISGTELDAVFPALDMNGVGGAGGDGVLSGAPGAAFLGVY